MFFTKTYSSEENNLYNPAYVGAILYQCIRHHQTQSGAGLHCTLPYLVIPLALSPRYSLILPKTITTPIAGWTNGHEGELIGFADSASAYIDIVNSAIIFLLEHEAIILGEEGRYTIPIDKMAKMPAFVAHNSIFKQSFSSAGFLGRWFATASSVESIYTHFGVKP
jgi:hypothetical protein